MDVGNINELNGKWCIGDTLKELDINMRESLNLYLDEPPSSKTIFPNPKKRIKRKNIVKVKVDPKIAFATQLRKKRLVHNLTQKQMARKMGFKSLFAYQKLEKSISANPQLTTLSKIKSLFPELKLDDLVA